jgi:hypothetical protein
MRLNMPDSKAARDGGAVFDGLFAVSASKSNQSPTQDVNLFHQIGVRISKFKSDEGCLFVTHDGVYLFADDRKQLDFFPDAQNFRGSGRQPTYTDFSGGCRTNGPILPTDNELFFKSITFMAPPVELVWSG